MSEDSGTIRITRATRVEADPQPVGLSRKSADLALVRREAGTRLGTRGPHTNLFQGGLPAKKSAPAPELTIAERVAAFATARKLTKAQAVVFGVIAAHVLRYDTPLTDDGFVIAKMAGVDYDLDFNSPETGSWRPACSGSRLLARSGSTASPSVGASPYEFDRTPAGGSTLCRASAAGPRSLRPPPVSRARGSCARPRREAGAALCRGKARAEGGACSGA